MSEKKALNTMRGFTAQLDEEGIRYRVDAEHQVVRITYDGDHFEDITFTFVFDDDGESLQLAVFSIEKFEKDQLAAAYEFCNSMNARYRWLKFYVDSDDEFTAKVDAVVTPETAGAIGSELLHRAVNIVDEACKLLQEE